jgi:heavy metal translocating P-type ATPase
MRAYPVPAVAAAGLVAGSFLGVVLGRFDVAVWVWYAVLIIGGVPIVAKTAVGIARGRFAADIVAMLAIVTAIATNEAFAGAIIVLMQSGGEAIDAYGFRRASSSLAKLVARAPRIARRRKGASAEEVEVTEVRAGDVLLVRPGDLLPVDGTVDVGVAEVDESALTGEPLPQTKGPGERLLSGSVNIGQAFEMRATRTSRESQYSKIVELVRKAQTGRPPIQRLADRYAVWFTPATLLIATFGLGLTHSFGTFLAVLVVATPCPLILATPLAVISGVNRAAKESIIIKSGAAIEQIGKGKVVIFDKTGTLTFGSPTVEKVVAFGGEEAEVLRVAASVEQLSSHPVAVSIAKEGRERLGELPIPRDFAESPGQGVTATLEGKRVVIGTRAFLARSMGPSCGPEAEEVLKSAERRGSLVSFIGVDGELAGAVVFRDQLRPGVPVLMRELRELGVEETVMLTGDNRTNAGVVAREAGVDKVEADLLPEEKVNEVTKLTAEFGTSIMVGDGINDAPALATATVGVAMGAHGAGISAEAADVVLLVDDVTRVGEGMAIGQRMLHIAKQSIYFGMGGSVILMVFASFGYIQPATGAVMQEVLDIVVILNALRVR